MKKLGLLLIIAMLAGCSGGSSSGGSGTAVNYLKNCQICSYDYECESGWCAGPYEKTNAYRCTPKNANRATWRCPVNYAKLTAGSILEDMEGVK